MGFLRHWLRIAIDAAYAFGEDDGWALASHIALSALLALFPFLIVLTALAGFVGSKEIADNLAGVLLVKVAVGQDFKGPAASDEPASCGVA